MQFAPAAWVLQTSQEALQDSLQVARVLGVKLKHATNQCFNCCETLRRLITKHPIGSEVVLQIKQTWDTKVWVGTIDQSVRAIGYFICCSISYLLPDSPSGTNVEWVMICNAVMCIRMLIRCQSATIYYHSCTLHVARHLAGRPWRLRCDSTSHWITSGKDIHM